MASAKVSKTTKTKAVRPKKEAESLEQESHSVSSKISSPRSFLKSYRPNKKAYLIIFVIGLLILSYYKKSWFVVATVNGSPITNYELLSRMDKQYHQQILTQMINEKLLLGEAQKNGVTIGESDVNQKISQIETSVGGAQVLDGLLSQQGQTRVGLRDQVKLQLTIEKMYEKDASVSSQEVADFISKNKDQLQSSDSAEQSKEATDIIKQQKISKIFGDKFQQLKTQANIKTF